MVDGTKKLWFNGHVRCLDDSSSSSDSDYDDESEEEEEWQEMVSDKTNNIMMFIFTIMIMLWFSIGILACFCFLTLFTIFCIGRSYIFGVCTVIEDQLAMISQLATPAEKYLRPCEKFIHKYCPAWFFPDHDYIYCWGHPNYVDDGSWWYAVPMVIPSTVGFTSYMICKCFSSSSSILIGCSIPIVVLSYALLSFTTRMSFYYRFSIWSFCDYYWLRLASILHRCWVTAKSLVSIQR